MTSRTDREAYVWTRGRWRVRAGEWILFALMAVFYGLTRPVGVWTLEGLLAPVGGRLAAWIPAFRRRAEENLAIVRPDLDAAARRRLVRGAGAEFTRLMVEYAHLDRFLARIAIEADGLDHLARAVAGGRGAVIVSAHYGNWETIRVATGRAGIPCGIIYRAFNNRYLDRYTTALIGRVGQPVLQKGPKGLRGLIAHLSRGGVILILVDQRNSGAPLIPFLGAPAETMTTAAELAKRTGAALVPAVARRVPSARRFEVRIEPEVPADDPVAAMAEVNAAIGRWIAAEPRQWFWFHRRWRRTRRSRRG